MRNYAWYVLFIYAFFIAITVTNVFAFSINLDFYNDVIYKGESANGSVEVIVNETGTYIIDLYALGYESWITKNFGEEYLAADTLYSYPIYFYPPKYAQPGAYAIYVYLKDLTGKVLAEDKHIIHLLESPDLQIIDVKLENPNLDYKEPLKIYVILKNYGKVDAENHYLVIKLNSLGIIKKVLLPVVEQQKETTYYWEIDLGDVLAGEYKGIIELYDNKGRVVDKKDITFNVKEYADIKEEINESFNFFRAVKTIHVKNTGNAPGIYSYSIPTYFPFLYDVKELEECDCKQEYKDNKYVIQCTLRSKETCSFIIIKNYWMYYLALILAIMVLVVLFVVYTAPRIRKYYYRKGHKYKVVLKIHNPHPRASLREVVVKDKVNGILTIREETIIPRPSRIKKMKDYTLIEWHINELKPGEERVITYEVIPKIDVEGDIVMHEAEMEGKVRSKRKKARAKSERK